MWCKRFSESVWEMRRVGGAIYIVEQLVPELLGFAGGVSGKGYSYLWNFP